MVPPEGTGKGVNSTNRIFREATEDDKKLIDNVYKKYQASTKKKNAAVTKGKIGNDIIDLESISGQN